MSESYPNIKGVLWISICFFVLFLAFSASANVASKALRECGFQNLGFYSLAMIYFFFGISSFITPLIVRRIKPKYCVMIASTAYGIWIFTLALTSMALKVESIRDNISYYQVCLIVMIASALNGVGASLLWVAQGKYLSDLCVVLVFISTFMLVLLPEITVNESILHNNNSNSTSVKQKSRQSMLQLMVDKRMIQTYGIQLTSAVSLAFRQAGLVPFISHTIYGESLYNQFRLASYAQSMFGIGQLVGSPLFGFINDKLKGGSQNDLQKKLHINFDNNETESLFASFQEPDQNLSFEVNHPNRKTINWVKLFENRLFLSVVILVANLIYLLFALLIVQKLYLLGMCLLFLFCIDISLRLKVKALVIILVYFSIFGYLERLNKHLTFADYTYDFIVYTLLLYSSFQLFILYGYSIFTFPLQILKGIKTSNILYGNLMEATLTYQQLKKVQRDYSCLLNQVKTVNENQLRLNFDDKSTIILRNLAQVLSYKTTDYYLKCEKPAVLQNAKDYDFQFHDAKDLKKYNQQVILLNHEIIKVSMKFKDQINTIAQVSHQKHESNLIELCETSKVKNLDSIQSPTSMKNFILQKIDSNYQRRCETSKKQLLQFVNYGHHSTQQQTSCRNIKIDSSKLNDSSQLNNQIYLIVRSNQLPSQLIRFFVGICFLLTNIYLLFSLYNYEAFIAEATEIDYSRQICGIVLSFLFLMVMIAGAFNTTHQFSDEIVIINKGMDIFKFNDLVSLICSLNVSKDHYKSCITQLEDKLNLILEGERIAYAEIERRKRSKHQNLNRIKFQQSQSDIDSDQLSSQHMFTSFQIRSPTMEDGNMISPDFIARQNQILHDLEKLQSVKKPDSLIDQQNDIINMSFGAAVDIQKKISSSSVAIANPKYQHQMSRNLSSNQTNQRYELLPSDRQNYYIHSSSSSQHECQRNGISPNPYSQGDYSSKSIQSQIQPLDFKTGNKIMNSQIAQPTHHQSSNQLTTFHQLKTNLFSKYYQNQENTGKSSQNKTLELRRFKSEQQQLILDFQQSHEPIDSSPNQNDMFFQSPDRLSSNKGGYTNSSNKNLQMNQRTNSDNSSVISNDQQCYSFFESKIMYQDPRTQTWLQALMRLHNNLVKIFELDGDVEEQLLTSFKSRLVASVAFDKFNLNTWMIIKIKKSNKLIRIKTQTREELFTWSELLKPSKQ
eukprot:403369080